LEGSLETLAIGIPARFSFEFPLRAAQRRQRSPLVRGLQRVGAGQAFLGYQPTRRRRQALVELVADLAGCDRAQVVVRGSGLVLELPDGEIDVRRPFVPVRFAGETRITSRLEAGPVEVVNLIGERKSFTVALGVLKADERLKLGPGIHIAYCAAGPGRLEVDGKLYAIPFDHCLRIDTERPATLGCIAGPVIFANITSSLEKV